MSNRVKKTKYQKRNCFGLSGLNLKNIPYDGDSRETLDRAHVKYVLPKGAFMSTFVQKLGLIWLKVAFYFSYSGHKCNCWLKIVNHWDKRDNDDICTGKETKSGLKIVRMETDAATHTRYESYELWAFDRFQRYVEIVRKRNEKVL